MTVEMKPLPRGRHGLSREEVAGSQRTRILRALAEAMAEKGYTRTSVADVLRRARVSRETFYEQFASKQDCFMSAFDAAYAHIGAALAAGANHGATAGRSPAERFAAVLDDYLGALAADPVVARVFLIEVYAAGPAALERRLALQAQLADGVATLLGFRDADRRFAVEALLTAIVSMVTARVAIGDVEDLLDLREPMVGLAARMGLLGD